MTDANTIREALGGLTSTEWPADPEYYVKALAALDALVAERDDYRRMVDDLQRDDERVQARVTELEAALEAALPFAEGATEQGATGAVRRHAEYVADLGRAALAKEDAA